MRTTGALLAIALLAAGCGRAPDQSTIATAARSWTRSAATGASLWRGGAVPAHFARHTVQRASEALTSTRADAATLADTGHAGQLVRAIDRAQRELGTLDSALAYARCDRAAEPIAQLNAIATAMSPLASDGSPP